VADLLAARMNLKLARHRRAFASVGEGHLGVGADAPRFALAKPLTYMNLSGGAVAALCRFYRISPDRLIVVYDELDLPFGQVRTKAGGGEAGHNGLRSISQSLSSRDYLRVRIGIGRPPGRQDPVGYVLADFTAAERKDLDFLLDRAADMIESIMTHGVEWTQNTYHAAP
jgi:PTH1 family peptidyl-tRNA hydrolase